MKKNLALLILFTFHFSLFTSISAQEKIILLNEGNWQADNGRLTYFEDGKVVSNQWYRDVNKKKLGDTPDDIIQINDNLIAIAINWSNIIQFITPTGKAVAATEDVPNNRKLASDGKYLYVSSYGHECGAPGGFFKEFTKGYVAKIDITTYKIVDAVEVGYEPEGIAYYKGHLFVANTGGYAFQEGHDYETTISIVNTETMRVVRTIDTQQINLYGKMSQAGQYLCINSPGDYYDIQACTIIFDCQKALNGSRDKECFVQLPYAATYSTATRDGKFIAIGSRYSYYTSEYEFNYVTLDPALIMPSQGGEGVDETLPGSMLSDIKAISMPYGLYCNPYTGYYYATEAGAYAEAGLMYQWNDGGKLLGKYKVYINPAHFLAIPPDGHMSGMENIVTGATIDNDRLYDIAGRRISKPQRGIYIRNGKKHIY